MNRLTNLPPGDILRLDFLEPLNRQQSRTDARLMPK